MPVTIQNRTAAPAKGVQSSIDTLFVPNKVATGKQIADAFEVRSLGDYETTRGGVTLARSDNAVVYDGLDNFFREGGRRAVIGTYDSSTGTIADAHAKFTDEFGAGLLVSWNETPSTIWDDLATAAKNQKRYALGDVASTDDTYAELLAIAASAPANDKDYLGVFGPWVTVGPLAGSIGGSNRQVPASSTVAALIARAAALGNPNRAPAGRDFPLQNAVSTITLSDANATSLRQAGINPLRLRLGINQLDGFRTFLSSSDPSPFWQVNAGLARMWLQWEAYAVGLNYEYKTIDGRGRLLSAFQADLEAVCKRLWDVDGLYGLTPPEAYAVNVGVGVNTDEAIARGELRAVVEAKFSAHAETVVIELVSVPITGVIS